MLRQWHSNGLTEARITKMQRLWLGSDFTAYMDDEGRIAAQYLNDVRRILKYKSIKELTDDICRTLSFYLIGSSETGLKYIVSNLWSMFDKERMGTLLPGSSKAYSETTLEKKSASRKLLAKCDAYNRDNISIINNPTGGDPDGLALSEPGEDGIVFGEDVAGFEKEQTRHTDTNSGMLHSKEKILRNLSEGRRVAREYLAWVRQQTDTNHQDWVNECLLRITQSRDMEGQKTELTDEQGNEVLNILLQEVLPYELAKRDTFFKGAFMKTPASRIYWLRNLTRHYGKGFFVQARQRWNRRKDRLQSLRLKEQREQLRQNRPISPYEWQDAEGRRWYLQRGCRASIPASAPPRPTEQHEWVPYCNEWRTKEPMPVTTQSNN